MSTYLPGFQSFFSVSCIVFVLAKLATSSIRVKVLSLPDEYPFARVSVIFLRFCIIFVLAKLATSSIRVQIIFKTV